MIEKEKHSVRNVNAVAAGRVAGIDPFEEIKQRCIRILDTVEHEDGGCVLCRCVLILCVIRREDTCSRIFLVLWTSCYGVFG